LYGTVSNPALRVLGAPREYIQGPGAIHELPHLAGRYGSGRLLAIVDPFVIGSIRDRLERGFAEVGRTIQWEVFGGECTEAEGERLAEAAKACDVVAGIGGGKCIDAGKYAGLRAGKPVFSVPTIASNDAPTSRLIVLYDEAHAVAGTRFLPFNPDVVLADTDIIAAAPPRFLRAGIGDALTKMFEARSVAAGKGGNSFSARPPFVAVRLGEICFETILRSGASCLDALARGERHADFEELIEALILLSGLTFESGGLSIAHAMVRGLTRVPELSAYLHGEQVAYSVLVQLVLEGNEELLHRSIAFNRAIGLPVALADFDLSGAPLDQAIETIAAGTLTSPFLRNYPTPITAADLADAMRRLERLADPVPSER
jgi:glycerol dehydrogenase